MWPHLDEEQRVDAILNVIMERPEIYFRLTDLVKQRAREIDEAFRPAFYQYIMNPNDAYTWRRVWEPLGNLVVLWPMFSPTEIETKKILEEGSLGVREAYLYAFGENQKDHSIKLYKQLLEEAKNKHDAIGSILVYAVLFQDSDEQTRDLFRPVLFEVTDWILDDFEHNRIDHWSFGIVTSLSRLIYQYGYTDESLENLKRIYDFFQHYDPKNRNLPELLEERLISNIKASMPNTEARIKRWENRE